MQDQKNIIPRTTLIWVLVAVLGVAGIVVLILAFRGSNNAEEDVNAIYTNAALTVEAQQLTLLASQPTATVTPFATLTPFVTNTVLASATLPPLSAFATNTQAVSSTGGCDNSVYISDVTIPDKTVVTPGQALTKTWKVQNSGTCAWTTAYKITYVAGNAMGGTATAITQAVSPGQSVDISVAMVAPTAAGESAGTWRLTNDKAQPFGTALTIVVTVSGGTTGTGTPTKTVTPTATGVVVAPAAPSLLTEAKVCTFQDPNYMFGGSINWQDNATNESGFRVFMNGQLLSESVTANSITYPISAGPFAPDTSIIMSVEAYNSAGSSARVDVSVKCP